MENPHSLAITITPTTLGQWLHRHLSQAYQRWGKQEAGLGRGDDPEAVHQMRVALRRLRAVMAGFEGVLDLPRQTRKVGMISRVLGQARDGDVMLACLNDHYLPLLPPPERVGLGEVMGDLRHQRQGVQRELVALVSSATYQRVKAAWAKWLDEPRWHALGDGLLAETLPHFLGISWGELALHPGWRAVDSDSERLHDLRKRIKRTRYEWEFALDGGFPGLAEPLAQLRLAQEVLGHLQDGFVLASRLNCPALQQILAQERAVHWQTWQTLRDQLQQGATQERVYQTLGQGCLSPDAPPPGHGTGHRSVIPLE